MRRHDALGIEVFVEGFEGFEGDSRLSGSVGGREKARTEFGWVLGGCCARETVVDDILGAGIC